MIVTNDLSVLRSALPNLQALVRAQSRHLELFSLAVVIGVGLEVVLDFFEHFKEHIAKWVKLASLIGIASFVIGGLIGEYVEGGRVSDTTAQIQGVAEQEVRSVEENLLQTEELLDSAQRQATEASRAAQKANELAGKAQDRANLAESQQVQLRAGNLRLQQQLEQERDQRLQLEAKYAFRRLGADQKAAIRDGLSPYAGQSISVAITLGDVEAGVYASDFVTAFRGAGLKGLEGSGYSQAMYNQPIFGLVLVVAEIDVKTNAVPSQCVVLLGILRQQFTVDAQSNDKFSSGTCQLVVGSRILE